MWHSKMHVFITTSAPMWLHLSQEEEAGWNYLNTDSEFRFFEGYSAFGFIQAQGRK